MASRWENSQKPYGNHYDESVQVKLVEFDNSRIVEFEIRQFSNYNSRGMENQKMTVFLLSLMAYSLGNGHDLSELYLEVG